MHNNALFFEKISHSLRAFLEGCVIDEVFSSSKDELFFVFQNNIVLKYHYYRGHSFFLKSDAGSLPKRNKLYPFKDIVEKKIERIDSHQMNRSFSFVLENQLTLVFKCYQNNGNILLFKKEQLLEVFRKKIEKDLSLPLHTFFSKPFLPVHNREELFASYPFLPRDLKILQEISFPKSSNQMESIIRKIGGKDFEIDETSNIPRMVLSDNENKGDLLSMGTSFARLFIARSEFLHQKNKLLQRLSKGIKNKKGYLKKIESQISEQANQRSYKEIGDILMANLHLKYNPKIKGIELYDFYAGKNIIVKLNQNLTLQKNAEKFYLKSKNQFKQKTHQEEAIKKAENQLFLLEKEWKAIALIEDFKGLKPYLKEEKKSKADSAFPFRKRHVDNYEVWIGKNAQNNDLLIGQYAHPNDLWLHARGVPGSHVLIKNSSGQRIPKYTLEKVASLAVFFSKNRNNSLSPVVYTQRKYVRKAKGSPAGLVSLIKEEVILVEANGSPS